MYSEKWENEALSPSSEVGYTCICLVADAENYSMNTLAHYFVHIRRKELRVLSHYLRCLDFRQAVVYVRNVERCKEVSDFLQGKGFFVTSVHDNQSINQRTTRFTLFMHGETRIKVLVTMCYGHALEMSQDVDIVINFDEVEDPRVYFHRASIEPSTCIRMGAVINFIRKRKYMKALKNVESIYHIKIAPAPANLRVLLEGIDLNSITN